MMSLIIDRKNYYLQAIAANDNFVQRGQVA